MSDQQKLAGQQLEIRTRIGELKREADALNQDLAHIRGQLLNLDPLLSIRLQRRNKDLGERKAKLERALFSLLKDAGSARTQDEEQTKREMLQRAAREHFEKMNVDPHLWKNLES